MTIPDDRLLIHTINGDRDMPTIHTFFLALIALVAMSIPAHHAHACKSSEAPPPCNVKRVDQWGVAVYKEEIQSSWYVKNDQFVFCVQEKKISKPIPEATATDSGVIYRIKHLKPSKKGHVRYQLSAVNAEGKKVKVKWWPPHIGKLTDKLGFGGLQIPKCGP